MEVNNYEKLHPRFPKPVSLYIMIFIFFFLQLIPSTIQTISFDTTAFNITDFSPNSDDIVYEGNASPVNQVIQLTTNQRDQSLNGSTGRATYYEPMHLWDKATGHVADFDTHFSFAINSQNNESYADGFAFFLAPNGSKLPQFSGGGNLGLKSGDQTLNHPNSSSFVAVEFDTFSNEFDTAGIAHVGIDLNSLTSLNVVKWWWNDIESGRRAEAWIRYNSSSKNLSVLLVDGAESDDMMIRSTRNSSSLYYILDLSQYLPEWITFGFSGTTGDLFELHTIFSWNFSSSLQVEVIAGNVTNQTSIPSSRKRNNSRLLLVVMVVGGGMFVLISSISGFVWFWCWMKMIIKENEDNTNTASRDEEMEMVAGPRKFSYKELVAATNNFADEGLLGEGGFGRVYLGFLKDMNSTVAVKKITPESQQGMKEYASEVNSISRLRHRNLIQLIGWCGEKQEFLIIYEFMPNNSLDFHLHGKRCLLTWEKRFRIALGLASAVFYLQEECEQCVLHRDIKSSNVLLDLNFNVKLGDFGLARLVEHGKGTDTTILIGTEGYVAPEYFERRKASKESDVYSFGIVALEIATGKKAIGEIEKNGKKFKVKLVEWVWEMYGTGTIFNAADPRLSGNYVEEEMQRLIVVGLACAHPHYNDRPSIRQAVDMLRFKAPMPVLPLEMPVAVLHTYGSTHAHVPSFSGSSSSHGASGS